MYKFNYLLLLIFAFGLRWAEAHTLPQSKAQLVVNRQNVLMHFKTPVEIMELGQKNTINLQSKTSIDSLKNYVLSHISVSDTLRSTWKIEIKDIHIQEANDQEIGKFQELTIDIYLTPSNFESLNKFTVNCDLIIHQIPMQSIIFSVEQDWKNGIYQHNPKQIGVIALDIPTGKIMPLHIKLEQGTWFKGFKSMINLGISHIAEGTDHLLFLLVLLLPMPLVIQNKKWANSGKVKSSLINILKIVTAFTMGHSITLFFGALGLHILPNNWIEILIGLSILVSAIHAIKPVFAGKELYIAAGFGLIHGLAFANTLVGLNLDITGLLISVLGFNLGIEFMQLVVIVFTIPWLLIMSKSNIYTYFRIIAGLLAIVAACGWISERVFEKQNFITSTVNIIASQPYWLLFVLMFLAGFSYIYEHFKKKIV